MTSTLQRRLRIAFMAWVCTLLMPASLRAENAAVVHPDVQRALDYQVPAETCVKPEIRNSKSNAFKVEKAERSFRRYVGCLEDYQKGLFNDFTFMQNAVRHGVTMAQAGVIKGHLEQIAATIKSVRDRGKLIQQGPASAPGAAQAAGAAQADGSTQAAGSAAGATPSSTTMTSATAAQAVTAAPTPSAASASSASKANDAVTPAPASAPEKH